MKLLIAEAISLQVLLAALISAIFWNLLTWYLGFPSSSSHAMIGGLMGAVVMGAGWQAIKLDGLEKILIALFTSPIIGFVFGFIILRLIFLLSWNATPRINGLFKRSQIFTGLALALSHGANDAQKTMGIITLALLIGGLIDTFVVPLWVIFLCADDDRIGHICGRLEVDPHPGRKVLQNPTGGWVCLATDFSNCHSGRLSCGRPSQHHPGGQFGHHGCRRGGKSEQSPLGCGSGNCDGLAVDHPGYRTGGCRVVLDHYSIHSIIIKRY